MSITQAERNRLRASQLHAIGDCSDDCEICEEELIEDMEEIDDLVDLEIQAINKRRMPE